MGADGFDRTDIQQCTLGPGSVAGFRGSRWLYIAPSLPVDVLLGRDIFCSEVGQQLGLGLAVVTRSQARQRLPQGGNTATAQS